MQSIPKRLLAKIESVRDKRPRTVLDHILKHGQVTTQELRDVYGYNHPPRAARDVRERGIPVETVRVTGADGRRIAAYRIAVKGYGARISRVGRSALSKALKGKLLQRDGERCRTCHSQMSARYLQVDHKVPYDVGGERGDPESHPEAFMLLCSACNRAKSWSCEHCVNGRGPKLVTTCRSCYWASPDAYLHVATVSQRRVVLVWDGTQAVSAYERLSRRATRRGQTVAQLVMGMLAGRRS